MAGRSSDISAARDARAVTAAGTPLPNGTCRSLYVGTAGDVTGVTPYGGSVTFTAVPAGMILPVQFTTISACPANTVALY